jgi:hypothetical protein
MSDEQRERLLIAEQIERAKTGGDEQGPSGSGSSESPPPVEEGLKREEGAEKVVLSFSAKPVAAMTMTPSVGIKLGANPLKAGANPLKRPNVFKTATSNPMHSTSTPANTKRPAPPQSDSCPRTRSGSGGRWNGRLSEDILPFLSGRLLSHCLYLFLSLVLRIVIYSLLGCNPSPIITPLTALRCRL